MNRYKSNNLRNFILFFFYLMVFLTILSDGENGSGKSLTLAHLLHYAHEQGFLIVHVPWGE